jgi:hypothetical protein
VLYWWKTEHPQTERPDMTVHQLIESGVAIPDTATEVHVNNGHRLAVWTDDRIDARLVTPTNSVFNTEAP